MKTLTFTLFLALICSIGFTQNRKDIDSLKHELAFAKHDTSRVIFLVDLSYEYRNAKPDSSLMFGQKALNLAQKLKFLRGEARAFHTLGSTNRILGDLPKGIDLTFKGLKIAEDNHYPYETARCLNLLAIFFLDLGDDKKVMNYLQRAYEVNKLAANSKEKIEWDITILSNFGTIYRNKNKLDSSTYYFRKANDLLHKAHLRENASVISNLARNEFLMGNHQKAMDYSHKAFQILKKDNNHRTAGYAYHTIAGNFKELNQPDSAIFYAKIGLAESQLIGFKDGMLSNSKLLTELYEPKDINQAYFYQKIASKINDEIYGANKIRTLQKNIFEDQERQREIEAKNIAFQNNIKLYGLLVGLAVLALIAFILYRNNRQKLKANTILQEQKEEIQTTLSQLKATQNQLIQSEKLASLGELTAGIAHEIQNPLNFVNNFAEMSVSLIQEIKEERQKKREERDEVYEDELLSDLSQNQEKINLHGKRASSIVTGMLEHSRASSGKKELTDINKLADESLRLSYHGLRAKDKNGSTPRFNSDFELIADPNLPKINVIPQDIGRVLINLINNAFYACSVGRTESSPAKVIVSTKKLENTIEIKVQDNGTGMSEATKAKIFQPFFTTKPTGQGTGLGLSLAYDIITKGHGGTLDVESVEGEGSEFIITLPIKTN